MREIKFRAWVKDEREMYDVIKFDFRTGRVGLGYFGNPYFGVKWRKITDVVLMQYANFKDKNGKEIYKEDIIKYVYPAGYSLAIVKFGYYDNGEEYEDNESGYGWYLKEVIEYDKRTQKFYKIHEIHHCHPDLYPLNTYKFEIVGNIYENPELLNLKK